MGLIAEWGCGGSFLVEGVVRMLNHMFGSWDTEWVQYWLVEASGEYRFARGW